MNKDINSVLTRSLVELKYLIKCANSEQVPFDSMATRQLMADLEATLKRLPSCDTPTKASRAADKAPADNRKAA